MSIPQKAKSNIVIGIEKSGSKPKRDQSQKEENIENYFHLKFLCTCLAFSS